MYENKPEKQNRLDIYRRKMRLSQEEVAHLLGHKTTAALSNYERGRRLPTLVNALRLGSILRTPVEFLFYSLNDALRNEIRSEEERLALPRQQVLF